MANRLWRHMGRHRQMYIIGLGLGVFDAACQSGIPMVFGKVLDQLQKDASYFMTHQFWPSLIIGSFLILLFFPAAFFFHTLVAVSVARLTRDMRTSLYQHVQRLSADFFHRHKIGEITQRLNNDMDTLSNAAYTMLGLVWQACVVLWSLSFMIWMNWQLTMLFVVLMAAVTLWSRSYLPKLRSMSRSVRDAVGEVSAAITEYVGLNELIKIYAREHFADARVHHYSNVLRKKSEHLIWRQYLFGDLMQVLTRFAAPFSLLFIGAYLLSKDYLKVGDLAAFWGYCLMMGGAINGIVGTFQQIFTGLASADRVFEFFDESPTIKDAAKAIELDGIKGRIAFESVTFNYPSERDQMVLDNVSFEVPAGRRVAIVGPSGAGKSTILQLILRFYDPPKGRVTIDGHDLRDLTQMSLRSGIGMVMQESVFFAGTIEENLRLAKDDATAEELREALRNANALEFVDAMPSGLRTVLGERGVRLSGGQKQRLSIARVFLKNPPILLFDEATSSLDSLAERQVQAAMDRLMKNRTTIIVAHRIATVQGADEILVLQDGRITACGNHQHLLRVSKLYSDLCSHQQVSAFASSSSHWPE